MGGSQAKEDARKYREGYPGLRDDPTADKNFLFYSNSLKSYPEGDLVENILKKWKGDYRHLEWNHSYIQWIFPIREHGVNFSAQPLQLHEADKIKSNPVLQDRVLRLYEMMLDFYGFELDRESKQVRRASNYAERLAHLNRSSHNYLRITRILKSLGELGMEDYKRPFLERLTEECLVHGTIANATDSLVNYWIPVLRGNAERAAMQARLRELGQTPASETEEDSDDEDPRARYGYRGVPMRHKRPKPDVPVRVSDTRDDQLGAETQSTTTSEPDAHQTEPAAEGPKAEE
eukprot:gnl/Trimastix_PCT/3173.p1 GENE.gnl/Trimastix_PCT/3173~~gnl/Trimastix_PCT/3173.p1  ORF type:complete len:290 (+),score=60.41 gnl/Trimastix_PCT/3173:36-905(+)